MIGAILFVLGLAWLVFQIWMIIHALKKKKWIWFVLNFTGIGALVYFFAIKK